MRSLPIFFAVPVGTTQLAVFWILALGFFLALIRTFSRRTAEKGTTRDSGSRIGIVLQSIGIGLAGFGVMRFGLEPFSPTALLEAFAVAALMSGAIFLFVSSSRALGRN